MTILIAQERLDELRARYRVSDVARRLTSLKKAGSEYRGLCPFHKEKTPSFYVNDVKGFAHCFGCGFHGDIIRLAMYAFHLSFPAAVDMIDGANLPPVDPARLAKEKAEDERLDTEAVLDARRFWEDAGPLPGTPADLYLSWRKIHIRPDNLRFGRLPTWKNPKTGRWNRTRPCLLLKAENIYGEFVGIQRIFLSEDGGKAPDMENPKLSLGKIRSAGGAVRFGRPREDVTATGSSEDGLTLYQRYNEQETVYVTCGEANLRFLRLPRIVRAVTLAGQNDAAGRAAVAGAKAVMEGRGVLARTLFPPVAFKDWNDELRRIGRVAA